VTLYLDTSALVKLLVAEDGSDVTRAAAAAASALVSSHVTLVEIHSALARMRADGRISRRAHTAQRTAFAALWADIGVVPTDDRVIERAADLAERHLLRGYDAVQLSSAVELLPASELQFACWDERLNVAAARERLALMPAA